LENRTTDSNILEKNAGFSAIFEGTEQHSRRIQVIYHAHWLSVDVEKVDRVDHHQPADITPLQHLIKIVRMESKKARVTQRLF
jgi:hypothetical protein